MWDWKDQIDRAEKAGFRVMDWTHSHEPMVRVEYAPGRSFDAFRPAEMAGLLDEYVPTFGRKESIDG